MSDTLVVNGEEFKLRFSPGDAKWLFSTFKMDYRDFGKKRDEGDEMSASDSIIRATVAMTRQNNQHRDRTPQQMFEFFDEWMKFDQMREIGLFIQSQMPRVEEKNDLTVSTSPTSSPKPSDPETSTSGGADTALL